MAEIKDLIEAQGRAFEEFKAANDETLKAKADGKAVAELEEKTDRVNSRLSELEKQIEDVCKKANRAAVAGQSDAPSAYSKAYSRWLRTGDTSLENEVKNDPVAINVTTGANGGYAVPVEQDRQIMRLLTDVSPMRRLARVISIGTEDYRKIVNIGGTTSGWVGETASRPQTDAPQIAQLAPSFGEIYANPGVTQKALDDIFFNVEAELAQDIATEFAQEEGAAFLTGNGTNKPKGLIAGTIVATADASRAFGSIQYIATGVAANFTASNPADKLLDMIYALKAGYRQNATFMCNSASMATIRKWKDGQGNYLWQPSAQAGQPGQIFGHAIVTNEDVASVGANAYPVILADFQRAYWIFDRIGIRSLRDPYTNKPYVMFYTTKRVGGMLADSNAVKVLKCATE